MSCWDFSTNNQPAGEVCSYLQPVTQQTMCCHMFYSLRMFAVFSVVISTSGSLKYSDATHLPFSDPDRKHTHTQRDMKENVVVCFQGHSDALRNKTKPTKKRKLHVWHLQSCSQVTLMFCDSYDSRGQELAFPLFLPSLLSHSAAFVRLSLWCCGQLHTHAATFVCVCVCASSTVTLWFLEWGYLNMCCPYRPRSKLSTGLSAAPSSPPCSGSAAGWCPPPWSASSLWTRPPPPAAARRLQTLWTGWSTHGCCMNSSGGQNEGREGCEKRRGVTRQSGGDKKKKWR